MLSPSIIHIVTATTKWGELIRQIHQEELLASHTEHRLASSVSGQGIQVGI